MMYQLPLSLWVWLSLSLSLIYLWLVNLPGLVGAQPLEPRDRPAAQATPTQSPLNQDTLFQDELTVGPADPAAAPIITPADTFQPLLATLISTKAESSTITILVVAASPAPPTLITTPHSALSFDFSGTLGDFTLPVNSPKEFSGLASGSYTIIEHVPAEWLLTAIYCDNGLELESPDPPQVTIELQPVEAVQCTFANFANVEPPLMHQTFLPFLLK